MSTPRFPALLDAWWEIKSGQNFTILFLLLLPLCYYGHLHTFKAGPFSEALSLARFPSRPSWTNSSKRFTINSSTSCSPCRFAAIFARAFITAREQCLHATEGTLVYTYTSSCVNWVVNSKTRCWPVAVISVVFGSWIDHRARLHTNLLEQVPNLLIDVLLKIKGKKCARV